MASEIERKFLVRSGNSPESGRQEHILQGYLLNDKALSVRVRVKQDQAFLTIKTGTSAMTRDEFEYPIPLDDARFFLDHLCQQPYIEKIRHYILYEDKLWEVDVFKGENEGLILAEVELMREDEKIAIPAWVEREVTGDPRYYNARLIEKPYKTWDSE